MSAAPRRAPRRAGRVALGLAAVLLALAAALPAWAGDSTAGPATGAAEAPAPEAPAAPRYEFGHGLRLGDSGFTIGGYLTAEVSRRQGEATQLKSSHASAFVWWEGASGLKFFGEVDAENLAANRRGDDDRDSDRRVSLERLYLDYSFHDALTLRAGKFLTPIGRWNVRHADPLVWTTTRPLLTQSVFPHNVTGLMASGTVALADQPLNYALYGSNGTEWNADPRQDPFSRVRGLRLMAPAGPVMLGLSYARYEQWGSRGQARTLSGADVFWTAGGAEFSAEWLRTSADSELPLLQPGGPDDRDAAQHRRPLAASPWAPGNDGRHQPGLGGWGASRAAYVQAVLPLRGGLFAVGRWEWVRDVHLEQTVQQWVLGLAWRPSPGTSLKVEWLQPRQANTAAPKGLVASVSVLF